MDLQEFSIKELLVTAIKSEEENYQLYSTLEPQEGNEEMASKLEFLSGEELKHKNMLEQMFARRFPGEGPIVDDVATDVPLPFLDLEPGYHPAEELLSEVMEAEKVTVDFYSSWRAIYPWDDNQMTVLLENLSDWEMSHYEMVKDLKERTDKKERMKVGTHDKNPTG